MLFFNSETKEVFIYFASFSVFFLPFLWTFIVTWVGVWEVNRRHMSSKHRLFTLTSFLITINCLLSGMRVVSGKTELSGFDFFDKWYFMLFITIPRILLVLFFYSNLMSLLYTIDSHKTLATITFKG